MSENVLKVYRSEWKFYISLGEYHYLKGLLSGIMTPDPHMEDKGEYYIRSLYFDSAEFQIFARLQPQLSRTTG